jgi:hypothetical protein
MAVFKHSAAAVLLLSLFVIAGCSTSDDRRLVATLHAESDVIVQPFALQSQSFGALDTLFLVIEGFHAAISLRGDPQYRRNSDFSTELVVMPDVVIDTVYCSGAWILNPRDMAIESLFKEVGR